MRAKTVMALLLVFALIGLTLAPPALSSAGGVGNRNLQSSDCGFHSVASTATISMSTSNLQPAEGEKITVSVTVSGGASSGKMGVMLTSKLSGTTGTTPPENGWTIVSDPSGTTYNYVETAYSGSKTYVWTLTAPPTAGVHKLYAMAFHGSAAYVKVDTNGLSFIVQAQTPPPPPAPGAPSVQITAPSNGQTVKGVIDVIATVSAQGSATIRSVELKVDGKMVSVLSAEPFHWMLNTTQYADGSHTLTLTAIDSIGASGTAQLFIDVANAPIDPLVVGGQAANSGLTSLDMIVVQILLVITLTGTLLHGRIRRK